MPISSAFSNVISKRLDSNYSCPFCGAPKESINVYSLNDLADSSKVEFSTLKVGLTSIKPFQLVCSNCNSSWVMDDKNETNPTVYNTTAFSRNMFKTNDVGTISNTLKFSDFYTKTKQNDVLLAPDGGKLTFPINPMEESEKNIFIKSINESSKPQKIKLQKRYNINYKDGQFFAVQEPSRFKPKSKISESMYLDSVKKLDEKFQLNGKLVRLVEKHEKVSVLEQKIYNYLNKSKTINFTSFIDNLSESFSEEAKYISIVRSSILGLNESGDVNDRIRDLEEMKTKMKTKISEYDKRISELRKQNLNSGFIKDKANENLLNESLINKLEKFINKKVKIGDYIIKGYHVNIDNIEDNNISINTLNRDEAIALMKEFRKAGFKPKKYDDNGISLE
jgi:hypothetical protein